MIGGCLPSERRRATKPPGHPGTDEAQAGTIDVISRTAQATACGHEEEAGRIHLLGGSVLPLLLSSRQNKSCCSFSRTVACRGGHHRAVLRTDLFRLVFDAKPRTGCMNCFVPTELTGTSLTQELLVADAAAGGNGPKLWRQGRGCRVQAAHTLRRREDRNRAEDMARPRSDSSSRSSMNGPAHDREEATDQGVLLPVIAHAVKERRSSSDASVR